MKVYVIRWFSAEPYEDYSGVHKVFDSYEKAENYLTDVGTGPHMDMVDSESYYLSETIETHKLI